jgi:DNA-binding transcriptional LysR family regulator
LFQRRPFELTKQGRELFRFIAPFFEGLADMDTQLRGGRVVRLRIGAPEAVQHNYLPTLLRALRKGVPSIAFTLLTGSQDFFEEKLLSQELDIVFTTIHAKPQSGIKHREYLRLPLALLVSERSPIKSADQLWKRDRIEEPLLSMGPKEPIASTFQEELRRRKIEWYPSLELASLDLVCRYVAEGFGIGLTVIQKDAGPPKGTRHVPLTGFPDVPFVAMWTGKNNPLLELIFEVAQGIALKLQ